jgi:hypothetical protein
MIEENVREEAGTSQGPQAEIVHLNEKIARLEKDLQKRDHMERQQTQEESLRGDQVDPENEGGRAKEVVVEESDTDGDIELADLIRMNDKEKREWAEKLTRLEQHCDYLMGSNQPGPKAKASLADSLFSTTTSPFTDRIMSCRLPSKFKMPEIPMYTRLGDPNEHLAGFRAHAVLYTTPDEVACRAFPLTLAGGAREWFNTLPPRSVPNFESLAKKFASLFMAGIVRKKPS